MAFMAFLLEIFLLPNRSVTCEENHIYNNVVGMGERKGIIKSCRAIDNDIENLYKSAYNNSRPDKGKKLFCLKFTRCRKKGAFRRFEIRTLPRL